MDVRKNPWLKDANRRSMTQVKITSLNLHGTGRRKGFIRPAEIFTTMFKMEVRVGRRRGAEGPYAPVWTQSRTFDEFREFYERLVTTGGANAKEKLTVRALLLCSWNESDPLSILCRYRSHLDRMGRPTYSFCWSAGMRWSCSYRCAILVFLAPL